VRDKNVHKNVINNVILFTKTAGFDILGLDFSPIRGPEGNIEYLMHICRGEMQTTPSGVPPATPPQRGILEDGKIDVDVVVEQSHEM